MKDGEVPIQWDDSGTKLYVWDRTFPAYIFLVDLKTGARQLWTTLVPPDSAGVLYGNIVMTPNGKTSVYRYRRATTTLYLAEGPALALFLCAVVSIALVLSGSFDALIAIGSILFVAVYLSGFASLLILRKSEPDLVRPYKAWWYPWSTLLVLLASTAFLLGSVIGDLKHSLFTAILVLLSYVASILIVRQKSHEQA